MKTFRNISFVAFLACLLFMLVSMFIANLDLFTFGFCLAGFTGFASLFSAMFVDLDDF